jgi:hypothetical protein
MIQIPLAGLLSIYPTTNEKKKKLFCIHLTVKQQWSGQKHLIGSQVFIYSLPDYS